MNSKEIRDIIVQFNTNLKKAGLDWVVQEVSTVVERGIEEQKQVSFESFDASDEPIKKPGRKAEVTTTRPLTEIEELRLLIASVRAVVIDANEMQEKALLGLKSDNSDTPKIAFRPDLPEGFEDKGYSVTDSKRGHSFDLSLAGVEDQRRRIEHFKITLAQLEGMLNAN